jgi:prenylcysteine oxidase/farnesylcysteine lyase
VSVNHILVNATDTFNLPRQDALDRAPEGHKGPGLGIWNGEEFVFTQNAEGGWWDTARLFWRYGLSPVKALRAMRASVGRFLELYDTPIFPFKDLGEELLKLGLLNDTGVTGEQLLREKGVSDLFAQELVQAR